MAKKEGSKGKGREFKSSVFSMLLEDPRNCLEIYNALNETAYDNPDDVMVNRLENGIILTVRNDASFLIDSYINIYEHQSTFNPNMPLRSLIYFVDILKESVMNDDLYSRRFVKIPTPHFVVFYNGMEKRPEKEELRLSSAYIHQVDEAELELKCTVYNINIGSNREFLSKCTVLDEYMTFVDKVRCYLDRNLSIEMALDNAIEKCIEENVLKDFLTNRGDEVRQVAALDYTFERREKLFRKEEREEGIKIGKNEERERGISIFIKDKIEDGIDKEIIIKKLVNYYGIAAEEALEYYNKYS